MRVEVKLGDILEEPADILICSTNVYLQQSGGVGGEILRRYGDTMQQSLNRCLIDRGLKYVAQGEVIETAGAGTPFKHVLHAVAVDVWYRSSAQIISRVLQTAFKMTSELRAKKVAVVALATGFGRLSMSEFGKGLATALMADYKPLEVIAVIVRQQEHAEIIREELRQLPSHHVIAE
ncbi:MAG: macro domain-containing protein [Planctomycetota bacterium]|nr:macro domain-containing protein [Planctomycetota bacterium]